jgi:hypothetical protein
MRNPYDIAWKRIVAEGVAIVVSILLAFWIDAWWAAGRESDEVREMLSAALEDFQRSKSWVENRRAFASARQESIARLLEFSNEQSAELDENSIDGLLSDVGWFQSEVPVVTSALHALISSGKLGLVENVALRRDLSEWSSDIEYIQAQVAQDYYFSARYWGPFMQEHGYFPQIAAAQGVFPGDPSFTPQEFPFSPSMTIRHSQLLSDREFQNVLYIGWSVQRDILLALQHADEQLDESIGLLRGYLGSE